MANLHHTLHLWEIGNANIRIPNVHEVTGSAQVLDMINIILMKQRSWNINLILVVSLTQSFCHLWYSEIIEGMLDEENINGRFIVWSPNLPQEFEIPA